MRIIMLLDCKVNNNEMHLFEKNLTIKKTLKLQIVKMKI